MTTDWKAVALELLPSKPQSEPCGCYEKDEDGWYIFGGCDCGNYDDAQYAGMDAQEWNDYTRGQKVLEKHNVNG